MNAEKLAKMAGAVRTGGKGSVRRKKKAVHKTTATDDKRLHTTLKRLGVNTVPNIEEVNIFKEDSVICFSNPKVQTSAAANILVVSGTPQTKSLEEANADNYKQWISPDALKKLAEHFQKQTGEAAPNAGMATIQEDEDEVPQLVEGQTFEAAAEEGQKS